MNGDPERGYAELLALNVKPKRPKPPELEGFERWKKRVTNPSNGVYYQNPEFKDRTYPYMVVNSLKRVYDIRTKKEYLTTDRLLVGCDTEMNEDGFPQIDWEMFEKPIPITHRQRNPMTNQVEPRTTIKETYMEFTVPFTEKAVKEAVKLASEIRPLNLYVREEGRSLEAFTVPTIDEFINKDFKELFYEPHAEWFKRRGLRREERINASS